MSSRPQRSDESAGYRSLIRLTQMSALAASMVVASAVFAETPMETRELAVHHGLKSLKEVKVPKPGNFKTFVRDANKLAALGKALFWDEQLGSDGQACHSCHFHAGADNRSLNQLDPGLRNETPGVDTTAFSTELGFGPNYQLLLSDFPFHKLADPNDSSSVISDTDDICSSQGVLNAAFQSVGIPTDLGVPSLTGPGAIFNVDGRLVRNVEPRNTPTSINSVLNHRNFWDGRARPEFNGVSPIGDLDNCTRLVKVTKNGPTLACVRVGGLMSTASQAVGPPLSDMEMSFAGRRFMDVGRKMLNANLIPLGDQLVELNESLLGGYSGQLQAPGTTGLTVGYASLIQGAFQPMWWSAPGWVVDVSGSKPVLVQGTPTATRFTLMEYNFSLYFGLAVAEYERTLISDDAPFDRFMEGDDSALSEQQQSGLRLFLGKAGCINCHSGAEFSNASVSNVQGCEIIERMIMGNNRLAVYDNGFYNIGVRPTSEDLGVGARIGPKNKPISYSGFFQECVKAKVRALQKKDPTLSYDSAVRQANQACAVPPICANLEEAAILLARANELLPLEDPTRAAVQALLDQVTVDLLHLDPVMAASLLQQAHDLLAMGGGDAMLLADARMLLPDPVTPGVAPHLLAPPLQPDERIAVKGAHKASILRNVELTAPYFHNGGQATLKQVVQFYDRGGDFRHQNMDDLDPDIHPLELSDAEEDDIVAFLVSLTDERVRDERAPFDHPSGLLPNGGGQQAPFVPPFFVGAIEVLDDMIFFPAVGADGNEGVGGPLGQSGTVFANFLDPLQ